MRQRLPLVITVLLVIGLLPSAQALSADLSQTWPGIFRWIGPLNLLKLGWPALWIYVVAERRRLSACAARAIIAALAIGTAATLIAGSRCGMPPMLLREWFVITIGLAAGVCLALVPPRHRFAVFSGWMGVVLLAAVLDVFSPWVIDALYARIFDPETRYLDVREVGARVLTGVFGRQSMAKLLAWLPWLAAYGAWERFCAHVNSLRCRAAVLICGIIGILSTGAILATSQRGPFLAAICAWIAFVLHLWWWRRDRRLIILGVVGLALSALATYLFVPKQILEPRVRSAIGLSPQGNPYGKTADDNRSFRTKMAVIAITTIVRSPLGDACIPVERFHEFGISPGHSHNLLLQQFRDRGWIWGLLHAWAWLLAALATWRRRTLGASLLFAGLTSVLVSGLFDHPWFVLNHAIVLGAYLALGLAQLREPDQPRTPEESAHS
jgi:hypothetical protein